jgi:hypothetical protein
LNSDLEIGYIGIEVDELGACTDFGYVVSHLAGVPTGIDEMTWTANRAVHVMIFEHGTRWWPAYAPSLTTMIIIPSNRSPPGLHWTG